MKSDSLWRHIVVPLGIALLVYAVFYAGIENRRTRRGPWQVTFTNAVSGAPAIVINQPKLAITNLEITFAGEIKMANASAASFTFDQPRPVPYDVPFGKCVFMDTTFLPGTLVFDVFGHEIQLIPRVLTIDKMEIPWRSNASIAVPTANAVPTTR